MLIPISVVDDFFEDPDSIRNYAISQSFDYPRGYYPGYRTDHLSVLNKDLFEKVNNKLLLLFFNPYIDNIEIEVESQFQSIPEKFEEGWVHQDIDVNQRHLAGVIYLTPDAPVIAGTSLYRKVKEVNNNNFKYRNDFYSNGKVDDHQTYVEKRNEHNSCFERTVDIGNVYNRCIIYNANDYHKESKFFGSCLEDSRLTLCFKLSVTLHGKSMFPIQRSNTIKDCK
jgi:hypothetical protein